MLAAALVASLAAVASFSTSASAQSLTDIPTCAVTCLTQVLPSSPQHSLTPSFVLIAYYECQQTTCDQSSRAAAESYGNTTCNANGTPINITATPSGYSSGASAASTASATVSGSSVSSVSSAISSAASSLSAARSASGSGSSSGSGAAAATGSAASASPSAQSGAAPGAASTSTLATGAVALVAAGFGFFLIA
ncbi:hypothetical protein RHOSPDRAFT_33912 [Rhodotorula sp. JG-1b]|nr:hypothetical protein RHOSPDRAFT_33912 [Rhodotorula sp. JG-1b]